MLHILQNKSRESINKATQFEFWAKHLQMPVKVHTVDEGYSPVVEEASSVIACSENLIPLARDFSVHNNLWMYRGGNEMGKSAQYVAMEASGFNILQYKLLVTVEDLMDWETFPAILKPDMNSAANHPHPLAYRKFDSKEKLLECLKENPVNSREFLLQEYIEHDKIYGVSASITPKSVAVYAPIEVGIEPWTRHYTYCDFMTEGIFLKDLRCFGNLVTNGILSPFIYIQYIFKGGKYYAIDLNCRLSTFFDILMSHSSNAFYKTALQFMYGTREGVDVYWPSRFIKMGRIKTDYRKIVRVINPCKDVIWLEGFGNKLPSGFWDRAYSMPTFIAASDSRASVESAYNVAAKSEVIYED